MRKKNTQDVLTGEPADVTIEKRNASRKDLQQLLLCDGDGDGVGRVDAMPVFFGGRELHARGKHEGGRTKIPTERQSPIRTRRRCHLLRGYRSCHVHLSIGSSNLFDARANAKKGLKKI